MYKSKSSNTDDVLLISREQAAHKLGIGLPTLHSLMNAGKLKVTKIGRRTLFSLQALNDFIESNSFYNTAKAE